MFGRQQVHIFLSSSESCKALPKKLEREAGVEKVGKEEGEKERDGYREKEKKRQKGRERKKEKRIN